MSHKYVILATGLGHFLDPCAIVNASDEAAALALVAKHNPRAHKFCRMVAEHVDQEEANLYEDQGALRIALGNEAELSEAF